jgi:seryl-tRNA synthetase
VAEETNMASTSPAEELRGRLVAAGLLVASSVEGVFGRSETYESVVAGISRMVHALGTSQRPTLVSFPPVVPKEVFERTGYLESFPNLVGAVGSFSGSDEEHARLLRTFFAGKDWSDQLGPTDLVLCPAACHPIYPMCTGRLMDGGRRFEVSGYCFRHEPSLDPARMQAFRMHEQVYVGQPAAALEHRDHWVELAVGALSELGLVVTTEVANDPFFGRAGDLFARHQINEARKIEIVSPLPGYAAATAVASGNWHQDHFGSQFGIQCADGTVAHSSCFGFGLDRIAIALLCAHGLDPTVWPGSVRSLLWP